MKFSIIINYYFLFVFFFSFNQVNFSVQCFNFLLFFKYYFIIYFHLGLDFDYDTSQDIYIIVQSLSLRIHPTVVARQFRKSFLFLLRGCFIFFFFIYILFYFSFSLPSLFWQFLSSFLFRFLFSSLRKKRGGWVGREGEVAGGGRGKGSANAICEFLTTHGASRMYSHPANERKAPQVA